MKTRRVEQFLFVAGVVLVLSACTTSYAAKKPDVPLAQLPPPPDSVVTVPISVTMESFQSMADGAIQANVHEAPYNVSVDGGADQGGLSLGYDVQRGPLTARADAGALRIDTSMSYWIDARGKKRIAVILGREVWSPLIYGSCGTNGEARRTANVSVAFSVAPRPDWMLDVSHTPVDVVPISRCCVVLPLCGKDATPTVEAAMENVLNNKVGAFVGQARANTLFRDRAAAAWRAASSPQLVAKSAWLQINPISATLSGLEVLPDQLKMTASFAARPVFKVGTAPVADPRPLPVANVGTPPPGGFFLHVPADLDFDVINARLADVVSQGAIRLQNGPNYIEAKQADLDSYGREATLHVFFEGRVSFYEKFELHAYLTGKPRLDPITHKLDIPDLEFTTETKDLLVKIADWIGHDQIRDALRQRAVFDLAGSVGHLRSMVASGITQDVGPVRLSGTLNDLRFLGVYSVPEERKMRTYLQMVGQLSASVK